MRRGERWSAAVVVVLLGLGGSGCYQGLQLDGDDGNASGAGSRGDTDGAETGGTGDPGEPGDSGEPVDELCEGGDTPLLALRFLTRHEYENTVRDLFGESLEVTSAFPSDEAAGGFLANSTQAPSSTQLQMFFDTAQELATIAVEQRLDRFVDCQPADPGCAQSFIGAFGRLAFRRPLTPEEVDAYLADYDTIAAQQGGGPGLEVVAASMLASPHFLYVGARTELDDPKARAYDLASRLSYFVWATMPDETLLQAAEHGELTSPDDIEVQVRRMLEDDRAADMLASFSTQWLEVDSLAGRAPKSAEMFPQWSANVANAAEAETAALMSDVVLDGEGTYAALLSTRRAWVDDELAAVYGVQAQSGGAWVELPEDERAGLLTRVAFLAGHAHATANSWVHRGKVVRERLLCNPLPPPPPVADDSPINDDSRLEDPTCAGCHTLMDPIGVGFDAYDAIGAFVGGSHPGQIVGFPEPGFDGPLELSGRLAESPEAIRCFATQMYGYANRRQVTADDACAVEAISAAFEETGGDIVELIVLLATADAFTAGGGQP